MTEQDTVVSIHQPPLKNGLFVWIRKSDSLDWERCQIHSLGVDGWVNLVRHGEIGPNHSRQLLPKGCWFVCSSQEPITVVQDTKDLSQIEYALFQQATGQENPNEILLDEENEEVNVISFFGDQGIPDERSKPTLLNNFDEEDQEDRFLHRPQKQQVNEEYFGIPKNNCPSSMTSPNTNSMIQNYLGLDALKGSGYKIIDILYDMHKNQENIKQIEYGISIVEKYIEMIIEINRIYEETKTLSPEILQAIQKQDNDLHHKITMVFQQIMKSDISEEEKEYVCQSLQSATNLYNEQKLMVVNYSKRRQLTTISSFGNHQTTNTIPTNIPMHMRTDFIDPGELELERSHEIMRQEMMQLELERQNKEINHSKDILIDIARKEAQDTTKTLERALKQIKDQDIIINELMGKNLDKPIVNIKKRFNGNYQRNGNRMHDYEQSFKDLNKGNWNEKSKLTNGISQKSSLTKQKIQRDQDAPVKYGQPKRQVPFMRDTQERHQCQNDSNYDSYSDETENDDTCMSLGARRRVNSRTVSQLITLEVKSKELCAKVEFCYNSIIIDEQTLGTYIDSEIFDAYKMNSIMLKQAEKLQEIHHKTDEIFIRTTKNLTFERKKHMDDLFQTAYKAYDDILETIKNIRVQMHSRSLVTHNMPNHVAKNIIMPEFNGEDLPHIHFFKKEVNKLLDKQNIAKSSRGFFIRAQIKGAAATVLTTELKNYSDPSDDKIYNTLETHFGEHHYILGLLTRDHGQIGKIPAKDKEWSRIYKTTTKHVALIRQMKALEEAQVGDESPIDGQYITCLFFYLGTGRQSVLASQHGYFNLSKKEKFELLKTTFINLEMISSKAQISNSNFQRVDTIDDFGGISGDIDATEIEQNLLQAIELDGCSEDEGSHSIIHPDQNSMSAPLSDPSAWQQSQQISTPPPPRPVYSCIICKTKATKDQTPLKLSKHPVNIRGKLLREGCPVLMGQQNMKARQDLLMSLGICMACLSCSVDDPNHGEFICSFPYANMICNAQNCKIRKTVCDTHKEMNESMLVQTNEMYEQLGLSLIIT